MKALRVLLQVRPLAMFLVVGVSTLSSAGASDRIAVAVDQARVVAMPAGAVTLIVGNPAIADVTILKPATAMVITGKGFGETNLLALDKSGKPVAESAIVVRGSSTVMLVQRGLKRQSYSCAPQCLPSAQLGDDTESFDETTKQMELRNKMASPTSAPR